MNQFNPLDERRFNPINQDPRQDSDAERCRDLHAPVSDYRHQSLGAFAPAQVGNFPPDYYGQDSAACRQSARNVILQEICRLRRSANELESLLRSIPEELSVEAEQALYDLAQRGRRT